ncbi:hypothetical protein WM40_24965 [Robbsia andropogonis]|uniref:Phage ABA sandwich domain-containing protein n=1 Tax=Robbsia andropogonis TaxID=28092 RepID=A0A0F5JU04_9BURK|nr:hypothetical protein [Robbsia andropogonis]KKB61125.1 hypothetical protein WM40_24965 [Robbsia andropogonis]
MTDRELLELAAKAAGLDDASWHDGIWSKKLWEVTGSEYWNPLEKDGDAFRLMVELRLNVGVNAKYSDTIVFVGTEGVFSVKHHEDDPTAATRRAIVMAAAEIGRGMG